MTADRWRDTSGFVLDQGRRKNTVCAGAFAFDVEMESGAGRGAQAGPLPGGHHGPGPRRCGAVARGGGPAGGGGGGGGGRGGLGGPVAGWPSWPRATALWRCRARWRPGGVGPGGVGWNARQAPAGGSAAPWVADPGRAGVREPANALGLWQERPGLAGLGRVVSPALARLA